MKKSFTFLKVSCVAALLSIMGISEGLAQGLRTSYFMDNVPARLKRIPALQPARGCFNKSGLSVPSDYMLLPTN